MSNLHLDHVRTIKPPGRSSAAPLAKQVEEINMTKKEEILAYLAETAEKVIAAFSNEPLYEGLSI